MAKGEPNEFVSCSRDGMVERFDMIRSVVDKRWLYIRNYRPDLPYVQPLAYMFQARGYQSWARIAREGKLTPPTAMFWGDKPAEELYDLSNDPDNVRNLATSESHRPTLERMRAALMSHTLAIVDNGFIPEGSGLEGYEASRRPGAYPLEQVVELANLASERNPTNLPRFIAALGDSNEAMRWWAAQGCAMLRKKAAPAEGALLKHLGDASWPVRLTAAEALVRLGKTEIALPILKEGLAQSSVGAVVLQTANILAQLGESARPALPEMKAAIMADAADRQTEGNKAEQYAKRYPKDLLTRTIDELEGRVQRLSYPGRLDQN